MTGLSEEVRFIIGLGISLLGGGLAGAFFTSYAARLRQRKEVSLQIVNHYLLTVYSELADVKAFLENPYLLEKNTNDPKDYYMTRKNRVRKMGDWLNFIAALCLKPGWYKQSIADETLLMKVALNRQAEQFLDLVSRAGNVMADTMESWPNLRKWVNQNRNR
jgi:hypothetical protein